MNITENQFLEALKTSETAVTIFLLNGTKLQGIIAGFDEAVLFLRRDGHTQLIYKNAVSTVMPVVPVQLD